MSKNAINELSWIISSPEKAVILKRPLSSLEKTLSVKELEEDCYLHVSALYTIN